MRKLLSIIVLFLGLTYTGFGQIYPVSVSVSMPYPQPIFLPKYYAAGSTKMVVNVQLNDFTAPPKNVKLKFKIENGGNRLETINSYSSTKTFTLSPGVPLVLSGADLRSALNLANMNLVGVSKSTLNQNGGKLPEGFYTFCVEVLEVNSHKALSMPACISVNLKQPQPPTIIAPECGKNVVPSNPQLVNFSWQLQEQPDATAGPLNYQIEMFEITDPDIADPENAVLNSKAIPIYKSPKIIPTNFRLDFSTVNLVPGRKYVYRIQALTATGLSNFANDGYSKWCWFSYGIASEGPIPLSKPESEHKFKKGEDLVLSWEGPQGGDENASFSYHLRVWEFEDPEQDVESLVKIESPIVEKKFPPSKGLDGGNFLFEEPLPKDKKFAWKVEAWINSQFSGESEIRTFYSQTTLEYFFASNRKIEVLSLSSNDINALAGKAKIQVGEKETDFVETEFSGLKVKEVSGQFVLVEGEIILDLTPLSPKSLEPSEDGNGTGVLKYIEGKVNKNGLRIFGQLGWPIPIPVESGDSTTVWTDVSEFVMDDSGNLSGEGAALPFETTLMDPKGFGLKISEKSLLQLSSDVYSVKWVGHVVLPEEFKTSKGERVEIEIENYQDKIDYIELPNVLSVINGGVAPIANLKLEFIPITNGVIDFSDEKSPGKVSGDKLWKGFYVNEYKTRLIQSYFDPTNQIRLPERLDTNLTTDGTAHKFWISGQGLDLKTDFEWNGKQGLTFNEFQTVEFKGELDIRKSDFKKSSIKGKTKIPFIDNDRKFDYEIPVKQGGPEEGYFEGLEGMEFNFNPSGGDNLMGFKVNRAVFVDQKYLQMNVDIHIKELDVDVEGLEDFRIYGNNLVGVGGVNQTGDLDEPIETRFKQLDVTIIEVGASFLGGKYAVSYGMESFLSEGFSSVDGGAPYFTISSAALTDVEGDPTSIPEPEIEVLDGIEDNSEVTPTDFACSIETPIIDAEAVLSFEKDDPTWGTRFTGGIVATVKIPSNFNIGGKMNMGFVDGMDYWYFDAFMEDTEGTGIEIIDPSTQSKVTSIVGFEGQLYRHVTSKKTGEGTFELTLAPNVMFGAKMFMQLIEPYSKGFIYQADLGLSLEIQGEGSTPSDVETIFTGEASFLNAKVRSGGGVSGSDVVMAAAEATGAADAVLSEIFPQSLDFGGTQVTLDTKGLGDVTSFAIGDYDGGNGAFFGASLGGGSSLNLGVAHSGFKVGGGTDESGGGFIDLGLPGMEIKGSLIDGVEGDFKMNIGDFNSTFKGNYGKKQVSFETTLGDVSLGLQTDIANKEGGFVLKSPAFDLSTSLATSSKEAQFDLTFDDKSLNLGFNGNDKRANMGLTLGQFEFDAELDVAANLGQLKVLSDLASIEVFGSSSKSAFKAESGSFLWDIHADYEANTGGLSLKFPNNELTGLMLEEGASVFMKSGDFEMGLEGNYDASFGKLHLKEGELDLNLSANAAEGNGKVELAQGGVSFNSEYNPGGTSFAKFENGASLAHVKRGSTDFLAHLKLTDFEVELDWNTENADGTSKLTVGDFGIETNVTASESKVETKMHSGDFEYQAIVQDVNEFISLKGGGIEWSIDQKAEESAEINFSDDANRKFNWTIEETSTGIDYENGESQLHLALDETDEIATASLSLDNFSIETGQRDSVFLFAESSDFQFGGVVSEEKGETYYKLAEDEFTMKVDEDNAHLFIRNGSTSFSFSESPEELLGSYKSADSEFSTSHTAELSSWSMEIPDYKMEGDLNSSGAYHLNSNFQDAKVNFEGSIPDNQSKLDFEFQSWKGILDANLSDQTVDFSLSDGDFGIEAKGELDKPYLDFSKGSFLVSAGKKLGSAGVQVELDDWKVEVDKKISIEAPAMEITIDPLTVQDFDGFDVTIGNEVWLIEEAENCQIQFKHNKEAIEIGDQGYTLTSGSYNLTAERSNNGDFDFEIEKAGVTMGMTLPCNEKPELTLSKGDFSLAFNMAEDKIIIDSDPAQLVLDKASERVSFTHFENEIAAEPGELSMSWDGTEMVFNAEEFSMKEGNAYAVLIGETSAEVQISDFTAAISEEDGMQVALGDKKSFSVTDEGIEAHYGDHAISLNDQRLRAENGAKEIWTEINDQGQTIGYQDFELSLDETTIGLKAAENAIAVSDASLAITYGDIDFEINESFQPQIKLQETVIQQLEEGVLVDLGAVELGFSTEELSIDLKEKGKLSVSEDEIGFIADQTEFKVVDGEGGTSMVYSDGTNSFRMSDNDLAIGMGENGMLVTEDSLQFKIENAFANLSENDLAIGFDKYSAEFTDWAALKISNGIQEFSVSEEELFAQIEEGKEITASLDAANPGVKLKYEDKEIAISSSDLELDFDGMHYGFGSETFLEVYESGLPETGFAFSEEGIEYAFSESFSAKAAPQGEYLKLMLDGNSIALTDQMAVVYETDGFKATLDANLGAKFEYGDHEIGLNQDDYLAGYTYVPDGVFLNLQVFDDNKVGIAGGTDEYSAFLKPGKKETITIGGKIAGVGEVEVGVNKTKDLSMKVAQSAETFIQLGVQEAKKLNKLEVMLNSDRIFNYGGEVDIYGDQIGGMEAVGGDGPSNISNISSTAGGWAAGGIKLKTVTGSGMRLVAQGRMQTGLSIPILCADAPFGLTLAPGEFEFKLAEQADPATIDMLCLGSSFIAEAKGHAYLSSKLNGGSMTVGVGVGLKASTGFSGGFGVKVFTGCSLKFGVEFSAELGFAGDAELSIPLSSEEEVIFRIKEIMAEIQASLEIYAEACKVRVSASASVKGKFRMRGGLDGGKIEGTVEGRVGVLGKSVGFSFDQSFTI